MGRTIHLIVGLLPLFVLCLNVRAIKVHPVQIPHFDLQDLGRIAFTGNFQALDLYQYADETTTISNNNGSFAVIQQLPNGDFTTIGTADGQIDQIGEYVLADNRFEGTIIIGNFTSIAGIETEGVAMLNLSSGEFTPLPGLTGKVNAMLMYGNDSNSFYVGGDFQGANSSHALVWVGLTGWSNLPFEGFDGPVNSIVKLSDGCLLFGGEFDRVNNENYALQFNETFEDNNTGLSGLFGYYPSERNNSTLLAAISQTNLDDGAAVYSLLSYKDCVFVGGSFQSQGIANILMINDHGPFPLPGGGLNDAVTTLHVEEDLLYIGGNFTKMVSVSNATAGQLSNVAMYSILDQQWHALGAGVNGPVSKLNPLKVNITQDAAPETVIVVNGIFDQLLSFGNNSVVQLSDATGIGQGLGIWVPSAKDWLQNLPIDQQAFYGYLSSCTSALDDSNELLCVGTLSSYGLRASIASRLTFDQSDDIELNTFNLKEASGNGSGTTTGMFHQNKGLNITIVAGQFSAKASDNTIMQNIAFINNTESEVVSGLPFDFWDNSTIQSLATLDDILYAGGVLSGSVQGRRVDGIVAYNLRDNDFPSTQPSALEGIGIEVKAMEVRPGHHQLYVGGNFAGAGSIQCPSLCVFDNSSQSWSRPGKELGGSVTYLTWTDQDTLIAAGNITVSGLPYSLATFYAPDDRWTPFTEDQPIPGEITAMSPANTEEQGTSVGDWSSDSTQFWIAGSYPNNSAFLIKWDGNVWLNPQLDLNSPSKITGIQVMQVNQNADSDQTNGESQLLRSGQILILTGSMSKTGMANASAVLFNGTTTWPLVSTLDAHGNPGILTQMFSQKIQSFSPTPNPKDTVIAIAVAVIAALILIIVVGEVGEICRQFWLRRKGHRWIPSITVENSITKDITPINSVQTL